METVAQGVNKQIDLAGLSASVKKLLDLKESDFAICRETVIAALKRGLDSVAHGIRAGAQPFCLVPSDIHRLSEAQIPGVCLCLDMLWCTSGDRAAPRGDTELLHRIVKHRWEKVIQLGRLPGL